MSEFSIGDVVRLKSGSPPLTVDAVRADDSVRVVWFASAAQQFGVFPPECLERESVGTKFRPGQVVEIVEFVRG